MKMLHSTHLKKNFVLKILGLRMVEKKSFNLQGNFSFQDCILFWDLHAGSYEVLLQYVQRIHKKYVAPKPALSLWCPNPSFSSLETFLISFALYSITFI